MCSRSQNPVTSARSVLLTAQGRKVSVGAIRHGSICDFAALFAKVPEMAPSRDQKCPLPRQVTGA